MKAVLVIDMPKRCSMCRFLFRTDEGYCFCNTPGLGFDYDVGDYMQSKEKGKPDWCPIKELPEYRDDKHCCYNHEYYTTMGWNDFRKRLIGDDDE